MKKQIFLSLIAACSLSVAAQDFDTNPTIKIDNKEEDLHFTVGARMMMDAAWYHTDYTPMKSGAKLTDARIRTSMTFQDWYFYADFDFSGGKFTQKNIFLQYSLAPDKYDGISSFKAGYFNDPLGLSRNTSMGSYHFISRAAPAVALCPGRELGLAYRYSNNPFYSNVGVFAENPYNNQISGFQGVAVGGRWLYRPINDGTTAFHIGAAFHYGHLNSGETVDNVKKTVLILGTPMETAVDPTEFVQAILPYANNVYNINAELMYVSPKFFARGEYMWKHVTKKRDDQTLFEANLGSIDSWGTLESWQAGNPLGSNSFNGAYVEAGYKIFGPDYKYNSAEGLLGGLSGRSLEIVARYSYTGLNDLVDGEYYSAGRDQYYPNGVIADYPATSLSVGGGNLHSFTIGANYSFNKFVQVMLEYNYNHLDRDKYMSDSNFNCIQGRLMFSF